MFPFFEMEQIDWRRQLWKSLEIGDRCARQQKQVLIPFALGQFWLWNRSVTTGQLGHVPLYTPSPALLTSLRGLKGTIRDGVSHVNHSHSWWLRGKWKSHQICLKTFMPETSFLVPASHYTEALLKKTRPGGCLRVLWESGGGATFTCLATGACRYHLIPRYWGPFQDRARTLCPSSDLGSIGSLSSPISKLLRIFPGPSGGKPCRAGVSCHHSIDSSLQAAPGVWAMLARPHRVTEGS